MSHKQFRMQPKLWLQLGPDQHQEARLGPLKWSDVMFFLKFSTPWEAEQASRDCDVRTKMISDAIYDWNNTFADDEGEQYFSTRGWTWLGIAIHGETESVSVFVSTAANHCFVDTRGDALDSQARRAALAAYDALLPLVRPEVSEG